jgi:CHAT domain-containing protein
MILGRACRVILVAMLLVLLVGVVARAQGSVGRAAALDYLGRGEAAFRVGDIAAATQNWSTAAHMCRAIGAPDLEAQALLRRGEAYRFAGYFPDASADLRAALAAAKKSRDEALVAATSGALGNLALLLRRSAIAKPLLKRSHDLAQALHDDDILAASANDLGNLYVNGGRLTQAAAAYAEAVENADAAHDRALAATAAINAARLAFRRHDGAKATTLLAGAVRQLQQLPPTYRGGLALVSAGAAVFEVPGGAISAEEQRIAYDAFEAALTIATASRNLTLDSLALGSLGRLYGRAGRIAEAADLTERALFAAQETGATQLLFRWEWQQGRLARRQGRQTAAIANYRLAVADLQRVRRDIPVEYSNGNSSYLATYGPVYRQLADLLLRRAAADPPRAPLLLREARDAIEELKASELQDYFRDPCVTSFAYRRRSIDTIAPGAAVLYPIVLPDRLEMLVSLGREEHQFTIELPESALDREVKTFRRLLEKRTTYEFLPYARELYDQLIRPIDPLLQRHDIDTLVVVPDKVLRLIPFAALYDGKEYLIQRYATAVAPSLHLINPTPLAEQAPDALVLGVSDGIDGFAALPNVRREVTQIHDLEGGEALLNQAFSRRAFGNQLKAVPFNVVHIASHGHFGDDPSESYVLAFNGRLTMDDLERSIKFAENRKQPLELLTLDACETATGDDRAALGLAGVALKAGARSALATLWFINDRAAGELVVRFYRRLRSGRLSKAHALQAAQEELIADPRFAHPAYWAPFLLIGNWL